jgi:hypothetical protein
MNGPLLDLLEKPAGSGPQQPRGPGWFDLVTRLVLPVALFLLAREQAIHFWPLMALAVVVLVAVLLPALWPWVREGAAGAHDRRVARAKLPGLRQFVEEFGEFLSTQRGDTLHYIITNACGNVTRDMEKFGLPHAELFNHPLSHLRERVKHERISLDEFVRCANEFHHLVADYDAHCVLKVFELLSPEAKSLLTADSKRLLESFREGLVSFLDNYSRFEKQTQSSFSKPRITATCLGRPKPLP